MWAALRHLVQDFHFGIEPPFTILKSTSDSHSPLPEQFAVQLVDGLAQARRICSVHGPWVALQRQWSKLGRVVLGFCPATCMLAVSKISIAGVSRYDILRMHQYVTLCVVAASTYPRDVLLVGGPFLRPGLRLCCDLVLPGRRPLRILRAARLRSLYVLLVVWEYARGLNNQQIGAGHHNNKPMGASADERVGGLHETHISSA